MYIQVDELTRGEGTLRSYIDGVDLRGTRACAAFNLRRTARAVTQLYDTSLREAGVRSTQYAILVAVAKAQPVSVGALAAIILTDQTTMTRNLRLMATDGLIEVSPRGARREKLVRLSKKGERVLGRATPLWRAMQARFVSRVGERRWAELRRGLDDVATFATDGS